MRLADGKWAPFGSLTVPFSRYSELVNSRGGMGQALTIFSFCISTLGDPEAQRDVYIKPLQLAATAYGIISFSQPLGHLPLRYRYADFYMKQPGKEYALVSLIATPAIPR